MELQRELLAGEKKRVKFYEDGLGAWLSNRQLRDFPL